MLCVTCVILQSKQPAVEVTTALYVTMEILSNWGNALQVGLTELQFFCLRNKKLYVSPHDLDIRNADYPGNLGALVNGKVKVSHSLPSSSSHSFMMISSTWYCFFFCFSSSSCSFSL